MARGGRIGNVGKRKNRGDEGLSDESDEDYNVDEDEEFDQSDDEYCSSLAEDESQDSLLEPLEEEEWVEKKVKNIGRPKGQEAAQSRKKTASFLRPGKKKLSPDHHSVAKWKRNNAVEELENDYSSRGLIEFVDRKPRSKSRVMRKDMYRNLHQRSVSEKEMVEFPEEEEEFDDNDDDTDEEFALSDESETSITETVKKQDMRRKNRSTSVKQVVRKRNTATRKKKVKRRKCGSINSNGSSDSDFEISGSSDYEYTVSEEEREQIREANDICGGLTTCLRSSNLLETIQEEEVVLPLERKNGKQKMADMKTEVGKQVCGICLSEEQKKMVIGVLNCCTHYFCFACIMEWSKVESRCPLCKQRFGTISRIVRSDGGHDVRDAIFPVPERDQVYQPSEEELRGYLDPYENVLCTECQRGGDDGLMLLCDLCDSPAHTYCVGLGHVVPDGNWYCDGCRPTALASLNPQAPNLSPGNGASDRSPFVSSPASMVRLSFDLNEAYVPETPQSQIAGYHQSPRNSTPQPQATSPVSGTGAITLSERRRIQRQIHQIRNNTRRQFERTDSTPAAPEINLFGSLIRRDVLLTAPSMARPTITAQSISRDVFSPRFHSIPGETFCSHSSSSSGRERLLGFSGGISGISGHQQLYPCNSTSNSGSNSTLPYQFTEAAVPSHTVLGHGRTPF